MHTSAVIASLGALVVATTLTETLTESTTVTVISCGPEVPHASCTGQKSITASTPPYHTDSFSASYITTQVPTQPAVNTTAVVIVPSSDSLVTVTTSGLKTIELTPIVPVYPNATATGFNSSAPIFTATGTPDIVTSVTIVTPSNPGSASTTAPGSTPTGTSNGIHMVVPGIMLGLLALGASLLG